jgi:hypothetical protein
MTRENQVIIWQGIKFCPYRIGEGFQNRHRQIGSANAALKKNVSSYYTFILWLIKQMLPGEWPGVKTISNSVFPNFIVSPSSKKTDGEGDGW